MAGTPLIRFAVLTAALLALALPAAASAVTNSVAFSGRLAMATTPAAGAPANTGFGWAHHIATVPAGSQPETADSFKVFFPSPLILNAQDFPACAATASDGQTTLPAECQNAMIGSGTATMYAGSPGSPLSNSVREDVNVTLLNGTPAGSAMLLVISSSPAAPIAITNRVLSGRITPETGYAFAAEFGVPPDLQLQLGLSITITDLDVTISGTPRAITVGSTTASMSYLQLPGCGDALPARQLTSFRTVNAATLTQLTSDASVACAMGAFPDPPGLPTTPYTSPRLPAPTPTPTTNPTTPATVLAITVNGGKTNLGRVKARKNGTVVLPGVGASCPRSAPDPCPVSGKATRGGTVVAKLGVRLAAGARTGLTMKLTSAGKKLLARRKRVPLAVALKAATPAGAPVGSVVTQALKLTLVR